MKYTIEEIKRVLKIHTMLMVIVCILASVICFNAMKQAVDYEALKQEKEGYEDLAEMQNSMIADLEENCNKLYIELENERVGGNK